MKKKIIFSAIVLAGISLLVYLYIYQDHRNIETERPSFVVASQDLISDFSNNPSQSETKFLNKTIQVSGLVSEINGDKNIVLDNAIFCQFEETISNSISANTSRTIKGRCIGYDDLLEEIKLDQCTIINK